MRGGRHTGAGGGQQWGLARVVVLVVVVGQIVEGAHANRTGVRTQAGRCTGIAGWAAGWALAGARTFELL